MSDFERILEDYERRFRGLEKRMENKELAEHLHQTAIIDYSAKSTIVGWSAFTTQIIDCQRTGKLGVVVFNIGGTSDSTSVTFTVPWTVKAGAGSSPVCWIRARDNTGTYVSGMAIPGQATDIITCYPTPAAGSAWTNAGTKQVQGVAMFFID
jgi:hypothetical protein